ncbi:MAG: site-2 protease family protein, partial [Raoultibacter sp.]
VVQAVAGLFNPATFGDTVSNSTSIMGIAVASKEAADAGFMNLLEFSAMISVSLGIMNLIPIPPLDGGRFVIEIFQKISKKFVSMKVLGYMSAVGMLLFVGLFLVMINQDIQRFIFGNWG